MNTNLPMNLVEQHQEIQKSANVLIAGESICVCKNDFEVVLGRPGEYRIAKKLLASARYPAFVGENNWSINAKNGGCYFYCFSGERIAISISNPRRNQLLTLAVSRKYQGRGFGDKIVRFLNSSFVRATEQMGPWFEKRGYERIGEPIPGRNLKTIILVKVGLRQTAGRLRRIYESNNA